MINNTTPRPIFGNKQQQGSNYLYTKGGELSIDGKEYIGQYHIYGNIPFTGGEHTLESKRLQPYYEDQNLYSYDIKTNPIFRANQVAPKAYTATPTDTDYQTGYMFRYYAQKRVQQDAIVYELSESDYNNAGRFNGLDLGIYNTTLVTWKLTGPLRSQIVRNQLPNGVILENEVEGIIDYNQKQIILANQALPGIRSSILDYAEFARPSNFNAQLPINTADVDPEKVLRDTVPNSVKNVFIKALKNYR